MRFRVISICEIPDDLMLEEGVDFEDSCDIEEVFWGLGGVSTWELHCEDFQILID